MASEKKQIEIKSIERLPFDSKQILPYRIQYLENGKIKSRDVLKSYDTVAVVVYNEDRGKLILLRQFRPAVYIAARLNGMQENLRDSSVSGYTLEMCGGKMDKEGKSPAEIAQEEIWEESGYRVDVKDIELVTSCRSAIGIRAPLHYTFYCTVKDSQLLGTPEKQIEIVEMTPEEVKRILHAPEESCEYARPALGLYALTWFIYEKLPSLKK